MINRQQAVFIGAFAGVGMLFAQLIPGLDLNALLRDVSPPALAMVGAYLILRDMSSKEAERNRAKDVTTAEILKQSEAAALRAEARTLELIRIAEEREKRRDTLIQQRIQPLSNRMAEVASVLATMLTERVAEREQMELATHGITGATRELNATTAMLKSWRTEDLSFRNNVVKPAIGWVQKIPNLEQRLLRLEADKPPPVEINANVTLTPGESKQGD